MVRNRNQKKKQAKPQSKRKHFFRVGSELVKLKQPLPDRSITPLLTITSPLLPFLTNQQETTPE
jgi:hypothetical protein